jgi:hypothetical protein
MMAGVVIGSNVCGRIVNWTGRYKVFTVIGSALAVVGMATLAFLKEDSPRTHVSIGMAILGLGIGTCMPITTLAVQNVASHDDMGAATSSVNFFRSMGSAFGVALFGTIMSSRLTSVLHERLPGVDLTKQKGLLNSPKLIRALPPEQFHAVAAGITSGVATVFQVALPIVAAAFLLSWFLKEIPLRDDLDFHGGMVEGLEEAGMMFQPNVEPAPTSPMSGPHTNGDGNGNGHGSRRRVDADQHEGVTPHS